MSSPELFLSNTFLFSAHQLCGEKILCNAADDICSVLTGPGASAPTLFTKSLSRLASPWPQCVKEPQTGLSHQTASPISRWPRSVITPCWYFHAIQGQPELYSCLQNQLESLLLLSSLAFKLIKLPTKYSLNFKASCQARVKSSHERDTQPERCDTED